LVVTNGGFVDGALCGSNAAMQAIKIGVAAMVIDGPARDSAQIKELGFGVWSTSITASKPGKEAPGMVNTPIIALVFASIQVILLLEIKIA
jgi:4-hydroxy-4-methyl-2-oxoglutarate aldolase